MATLNEPVDGSKGHKSVRPFGNTGRLRTGGTEAGDRRVKKRKSEAADAGSGERRHRRIRE